MTNPSIPPCPVCGTVPKLYPVSQHLLVKCCGRSGNSVSAIYPLELWIEYCDRELGRALRTHGIHTLAELESRLAPDPRVWVLDDVRLITENAIRYAHLAYCRTLEREPEYLAEMKRIIAAQRGEE